MATTSLFVQGDQEFARGVVDQVLTNNGFTLTYSDPYNCQAERGSLGLTMFAGAFAGKKQHMKVGVNYAVDPQGAQVVTMAQTNTGAAGGVIGASRLKDAFTGLVGEMRNAFASQNRLLGESSR
jgi:hypothetical protein